MKNLYIEMELFGSDIKNIFIFSQKEVFLIFPKIKKIPIFWEMEFFSSST